MTELASLILFMLFLYPLYVDTNVAFTNVEKYSLFTSFVAHIGLPKGQSGPFFFFSLTLPSQGLVSLTQGWRTSEGLTQNYIQKQPTPSTITSIHR